MKQTYNRNTYSKLLEKEKELSVALTEIKRKKVEMRKSFKNCHSDEEKIIYILNCTKKGTVNEITSELIFLDSSLTFNDAKEFVVTTSEKLIQDSKIGSIKINNQNIFYIFSE